MLETIEDIVLKAGIMLRNSVSDDEIEMKSSSKDLVTVYDKRVQEILFRELGEKFPKAGFLGEEKLSKPGTEGTFIIDPIDGTTNFIKGFNHSAISIGYCVDGEIQLGVVYDPFKKELYSAEKGKGATLNHKPIHCNDLPLDKCICLFGTSNYRPELAETTFKLALEMHRNVIDIRRFGTASLDFGDVSCGRADMYFEFFLYPWDIAAGSLIAQEAGAIVSDENGKPLQFKERTGVVVATPRVYDFLMAKIKELR